MSRPTLSVFILSALILLVPPIAAAAAPSSETLLPSTTKAYVSIADVDELRAKWDETQLGQLMNDPVMKPFADDLQRQIEDKLAQTGARLGLTWDDLKDVYGGEVCLAVIQPEGDKKQHALTVLADVTGHHDEARTLLETVADKLAGRGGEKEMRQLGQHSVLVFTMPKDRGQIQADQAFYLLVEEKDMLLAADHFGALVDIVQRLDGTGQDPLSQLPAFAAANRQLTAAINRSQPLSGLGPDSQPHIRWFIEPFGYIEVTRSAAGGRKRRGTDLLKVLHNQGFSAIQGLGGYIHFSTQGYETLHHTYIHAPPVERSPGDSNTSRFDLAARMLDFPVTNGESLMAQAWIPRSAASYLTFNWKIKNAFDCLGTLVDELAGEEGTWDAVLEGLEKDPDGPQVKVKEELIDHLDQRATLLTDYRMPITVTSERWMFAIKLANTDAVRRTVNKAMSIDPKAVKRMFGKDQIIWEILSEDDTEDVTTELTIDGPGFGPFIGEEDEEEVAQQDKPKVPNMATTVAYDHWIIASHVDFVVDMLTEASRHDNLGAAADYQLVNQALDALGAGNDSFRSFTRTDESFRPTYEMIRQGKMPQSESITGALLNRLLGSDEEGVNREQQIDGTKLPDYQVVRRYLGPAGLYVRPVYSQPSGATNGGVDRVEIGWLVVGCVLTKQAKDEPN